MTEFNGQELEQTLAEVVNPNLYKHFANDLYLAVGKDWRKLSVSYIEDAGFTIYGGHAQQSRHLVRSEVLYRWRVGLSYPSFHTGITHWHAIMFDEHVYHEALGNIKEKQEKAVIKASKGAWPDVTTLYVFDGQNPGGYVQGKKCPDFLAEAFLALAGELFIAGAFQPVSLEQIRKFKRLAGE